MTEIKKEALELKVKEEIKPEEEEIIQPLLQELLKLPKWHEDCESLSKLLPEARTETSTMSPRTTFSILSILPKMLIRATPRKNNRSRSV